MSARLRFRLWAPTVAALVVVLVTGSLGNWQLRRADEKRTLQVQRDAAERDAPIDVTAAAAGETASLESRRVRVRGRFVSEFDVFIDNRTYRGVAGFHVLSALQIAGSDSHVLVLRGWTASNPRARWEPPTVPAPATDVEIEGIALRELPRTLELGEVREPGPDERIWFNADLARFGRWSGLPMRPPIVRQLQAPRTDEGVFDDGLVREWPRPGNDVERHVAYAFQWYSLAALAAGLWLWFVVLARWRTGRRMETGSAGRAGKDDE